MLIGGLIVGGFIGFVVGIICGIGASQGGGRSTSSRSGCPHLDGNSYSEKYLMDPVVRELDGQEKNKGLS